MEQIKNEFAPEAATDEPASPLNQRASDLDGPPEHAFASEAEEAAYWAGVSDGIRNAGGVPCPRLAARARDAYPELIASAAERGGRPHPAELDFEPASTRHRVDGITPAKQREYVEALADTGIARYAAARVGVSPQAINRLRRKPEAKSFDLACAAAHRIGARRVHEIGWERALEGQIKRHYYHGQLAGEERVYDNKLLIYLMGKTEHLLDEPEETPAVIAHWTPWVEAMAEGTPPPDLAAPEAAGPRRGARDDFDGSECWVGEDNIWWTIFPPPAGFDGLEEGEYGDCRYRRTLSEAEHEVVEADHAAEDAGAIARETARRDAYFGFAGGTPADEFFPLMEAETLNLPGTGPAAREAGQAPPMA